MVRGRACDRAFLDCVRLNASSAQSQCRCHQLHTACLRDIDPKECLRGKHCSFFYHSCKNFYCKTEQKKCEQCYATTEYDPPPLRQGALVEFMESPFGAIFTVLLAATAAYIGAGYMRRRHYEDPDAPIDFLRILPRLRRVVGKYLPAVNETASSEEAARQRRKRRRRRRELRKKRKRRRRPFRRIEHMPQLTRMHFQSWKIMPMQI